MVAGGKLKFTITILGIHGPVPVETAENIKSARAKAYHYIQKARKDPYATLLTRPVSSIVFGDDYVNGGVNKDGTEKAWVMWHNDYRKLVYVVCRRDDIYIIYDLYADGSLGGRLAVFNGNL